MDSYRDKRLYSIDDYESLAVQRLHKFGRSYFNSGANDEVSLKAQRAAFDSIKLKSRIFVDEKKWQGTGTTIMGKKIDSPICITSTAFQRMAHPEGEVATAKACGNMNTPMVLSSWATSTAEEIGEAAPEIPKVYQIYLSKLPEVNKDIWARVKKSGFTALALTTDTQLLGKRLNDVRHNFALPEPWKMANFEKYKDKQSVSVKSESKKGSGLSEFVRLHKDNNIDWTTIPKIKKLSGMKVWAKGIMCREDALLAMQNGVDGIYVSNHGAR